MERFRDEDDTFSIYLKHFITDTVFQFYSRIVEGEKDDSEDLPEINKLIQFLGKFKEIVELLNEKPKHLLEKVKEVYGSYCEDSESMIKISYFLQECPLIEGGKLTEVLGAIDEKFEPFRNAFLSTGEFKDLEVLESMRNFFCGFYMTGETQVIDRVIGQFSEEYIIQNPVGEVQ